MTSRQRFRRVMRGEPVDRAPCFREGMREGVIQQWRTEGLSDRELSELFDYDGMEMLPVNIDPLPGWDRWPPRREGLPELRRRFDPGDPERFPEDWDERVGQWRTREHVLGVRLHPGFFLSMGVGGWDGFQRVIYLLKDDPALVGDFMMIRGEFTAALSERVLEDVTPDFASFSEPVAGGDGPLISPADYREVILSSYRPVLEVLQSGGVETLVFKTFANARRLLPVALETGFNCVWAVEPGAGNMDYLELRRQFGPDLRLIGGIDLDAMLAGEEAVRRQFDEYVRPLLAQGRYVPLADGRVRKNTPFAGYRRYRRLLERVAWEG